jgi:5-methyltetrahydrofolate--homocysteine methyltransferase
LSDRTPLDQRLASGEILVADGAMGTLLFERGLDPGACPESITLAHPEVLEEIARLYLEAGADIIGTNTFGGCPLKLAAYGLADSTNEINTRAVTAVRNAVEDRAYVAGSVGPCGKLLTPYGDAKPEEVYGSFLRQVESLIAAGVDCICVETMIDLTEAKLAVRAVKDVSPRTPVTASMTFDATPNGFFTIMGVSVADAVAGLTEVGADAIGSNCGNGSEKMVEIARTFRSVSQLPLTIQPNAGLPHITNGKAVYDETPTFMAEQARALISIGVSIIGGCCGTTPEHVATLRAMIDE